MENVRQAKLVDVVDAWERYQECQRAMSQAREYFIDTIYEAKMAKATQQQIADEVDLSRQRIAQFLDERKSAV